MHPLSSAAYQQSMAGYGSEMGGQQSPPEGAGSPQDPANGSSGTDQNGGSGGGANYSDINQILDQILNITDQSLDEAQVRTFLTKFKIDQLEKTKFHVLVSSQFELRLYKMFIIILN